MNNATPSYPATITRYLDQLRSSLKGSDPALIQDALYDAEDYLRSEMIENPGKSEAEVIAMVAGSYGDPAEVAEIYRDTEIKVQTALRTPPPRWTTPWERIFGVAVDPRSYAALFYLLLAGATGLFYFTWVAVGASTSIGLSVLIVGIPLLVLYFGTVLVLSLVEGRIVESMLGVRMPRRPRYARRGESWRSRVGTLFTDPRVWTTQIYFLLMAPLGVAYFSVFATLVAMVVGLVGWPIATWLGMATGNMTADAWHLLHIRLLAVDTVVGGFGMLGCLVAGALLLFVTLHLARGIGYLHGLLAKHLLVATAN
ncbi:MAG: sensor domain-containing protein [Rhodanobacter sp.]